MSNKQGHTSLTFKMAVLLAAPHTWAASIIPCLLGAVLCAFRGSNIDIFMFLSLTMVCILMQSAVNTFNDYADFIKGTDTIENSPDANDAVLVYNNPSPKSVLLLGFAYLMLAAVFSIPSVIKCGIRPVIVGIVGAVAVLIYSFGKKPLSYLPLGEFTSGIVMGGLIPFAVAGVLTDKFSFCDILYALPTILSVGLIMMTNNACDIDRDINSGRATLTVNLGKEKTGKLYRVCLILWIILPLILLHDKSCIIYIVSCILVLPAFIKQCKIILCLENRGQAMIGITNLNVLLGLIYCLSIICSVLIK